MLVNVQPSFYMTLSFAHQGYMIEPTALARSDNKCRAEFGT